MTSDNVWYSMNIREFFIVLAMLGVHKWYGFGAGSTDMPESCEDVNRLLADLYQNEVISFDEARLVLEGDYKDLFDALKSSEKCILSISSHNNARTVLSYCSGDSVVVCSDDPSDSDFIRLTILSKSDWPYFITNEMMSFDRISTGSVIVDESEVRTLVGREMTPADVADLPGVITVFDTVDMSTGHTDERLSVREKGLLQYMVYERTDREDISVMEGGLTETVRFLDGWME